ncbi:hypothetical protein EBR96_07015, partial [bacterium]|nr:hypothetical protein [bacterium]
MWATSIDEQLRVVRGSDLDSMVAASRSAYQTPFVDPTTGQFETDRFSKSVSSTFDPPLRAVLLDLCRSKSHGLSESGIAAGRAFIQDGILPSDAAQLKEIREFLSSVLSASTITSAGITPSQVIKIQSVITELTPPGETISKITRDFRSDAMAANGVTPAEVKFRDGVGLVAPQDPEIQRLIDDMMKSGVLKRGMSDRDIASAVTKYVESNFNYIQEGNSIEGRSLDHWQSVAETVMVKGGDCEDLAILTASLSMGALERMGYSADDANRKVSIAAGYLTDSKGNSIGHATVKFIADDGTAFALDTTGKSGPTAFKSLNMDMVFEGNNARFETYRPIDEWFTTALKVTHGHGSFAELIGESLKHLQTLVKAPVTIPIPNDDGKSFTYADPAGGVKTYNGQPDVKFRFFEFVKEEIHEAGFSDTFYLAKVKSEDFYDFMFKTRNELNKITMLFQMAMMYMDYEENQAKEIGVSGEDDYHKSELLETWDSTEKYKNRFVNAMNGALSRISSSVETVVNELFLFVNNNNSAQATRVRADIEEYGRENFAVGILSAIADELTGALDGIRKVANLKVSTAVGQVNTDNAVAYMDYTSSFGEGIGLWGGPTIPVDDETHLRAKLTSEKGSNLYIGNDIFDALIGSTGNVSKVLLQKKIADLKTQMAQVRSTIGDNSPVVGEINLGEGVGEDRNEAGGTSLIRKAGGDSQYAEYSYETLLRLRDYMVSYQNFVRTIYITREAENNAKRMAADQIAAS